MILEKPLERPGVDEPAAVLPRRRTDVDHPVRRPDRLLVVLDDEQRVAEVAQPHQRGDEPIVVALVQPDRWLVEDVEHAHQARADLGRQPDALCLAARERAGRAVERQVVEPDVDEEPEPRPDLLQHLHARSGSRARSGASEARSYHASASVTDRRVVSMMFLPAIVTDSDSGLRRMPLQVGHGLFVM